MSLARSLPKQTLLRHLIFSFEQQANPSLRRLFRTQAQISSRFFNKGPYTELKPNTLSSRSNIRRQPHSKSSRHYSSQPTQSRPSPDPTPNLGSQSPTPEASLSLSQRLRKLSREYGWSALGVYFLLSALDFPFCFAAVRMLGTERIGRWEHIVVGYAWRLATLDGRVSWGGLLGTGDTPGMQERRKIMGPGQGVDVENTEQVGRSFEKSKAYGGMVAVSAEGGRMIEEQAQGQGWDWGVDEADKANKKGDATIWTQLALAYAIHKSFIFLRIPATVAVTPKVVKVLRGWGWNVGKLPKRGAGSAAGKSSTTGKSSPDS